MISKETADVLEAASQEVMLVKKQLLQRCPGLQLDSVISSQVFCACSNVAPREQIPFIFFLLLGLAAPVLSNPDQGQEDAENLFNDQLGL